ncbi:purine-nucleoside phosphorylase [Anaerofustis sp.]|uniref:purine-nucleoside phosphorylase n=1 Tax=Anaerofustis sp. TaxID=1872517 RepID=UPI0025C6F596|nr:purine-nucleoside phosphorylase [Anaerofustis sp.]
MATPHINAKEGDFHKTVLMPGDPLRAKYIAEHFLEEAREVTNVRGMLGYSGSYKGKKISVMGSGMGIPSISIYSHELYSFYGVENIIRIGSCGGYSEDVKVNDVIIAQGASTNSNFASQFHLDGTFAPIADFKLLIKAYNKANELNIDVKIGNILSSDNFYAQGSEGWKRWKELGILGVEMEAAGLYSVAASLNKKALGMFTVSDHFIYTDTILSSKERETKLNDMITLALESFAE